MAQPTLLSACKAPPWPDRKDGRETCPLPLQGGGELGPPACTSANSTACMSSTHPKAVDPSQMPQLPPDKAPSAPALPPAHQVQQVQTGVLFRLMAPVIQAGGWAPAARPTPPDHNSPPSATAIFWQGRRHPGPPSLLPHHSQSIFLHCDTGLKPYHLPHWPSPESHPLGAPWPPRLSHLSFWPQPS